MHISFGRNLQFQLLERGDRHSIVFRRQILTSKDPRTTRVNIGIQIRRKIPFGLHGLYKKNSALLGLIYESTYRS